MKDPSAAFSCVMEQLENQRRQREEAEEEQMNTASRLEPIEAQLSLQTPFHPNRSTTHTMDTLATRASDLTPQLLPSTSAHIARSTEQTAGDCDATFGRVLPV
ncbi:hypothetical protein BLNAU_24324 [Blattamonas nauphoetae]|uniref:Uncharacterized protein n=1 Tax=Blattamonas nauphoetae TaxID=2049346 RepID=A0ABQ9WMS1_9EUKA|nr:hypothetical protein BLNAU_24324 [Blattamonas nauphoetae]